MLVTATAHPLFGSRLTAYAFRHVDGVLHLKVRLPEGLPGLVRADATDVHGDGQERPGLVLDVAGLRELRVLVLRLRDGMAGSGAAGEGRPVSAGVEAARMQICAGWIPGRRWTPAASCCWPGSRGIRGDAVHAVRLSRVEAMILEWIGRGVMVSIHRALAAGADPARVAAAAGTSLQEISAGWRPWAQGQLLLEARCPGLGLDAALYRQIAAVLDTAVPDADVPAHAG